VQPFTVPHDAREPVQYVLSDGASRLGVLTDVGRATPHIEAQLSGCDALVLECNYDPGMLEGGPYPPSLKARIAAATDIWTTRPRGRYSRRWTAAG